MNLQRLLAVIIAVLVCTGSLYAVQKPDDREALAGLTSAKVIFDVRVPDLDKLNFNLNLFKETYEGMVAQGVKPQMIIVFRGPGVRLLTNTALDDEAKDLIRDLKKLGVRFEACALAMRVFKADPEKLFPEVKLVANVINSLIGYQNKGYAMITIN
ncbi:dsrE family protein [Geoanaerobacter pelophilus]|uniref:DsrE family protein n=1 Tax=Geoanaerobacter pelophilus TaxID=60036 RepID=A0ABQ0MLG5_9BACT|nr:DsrE family protein [Geoanaerobacter pelophilus]GAW67908.1 dsrE family protein [Geoanaerobacter pelophilus]